MKGPFEAAISVLKNRLANRGPGSERNELEQGIRVLEAAEHTNVKDCLKFLERINEDGEMRDKQSLLLFPLAQIRNLLRKALPEPEEERK